MIGRPFGERHCNRPGFALIAVLWMIVGMSLLAFAASMVGRSTIATARNRIAMADARWKANGCVERAHAAIADAILAVPPSDVIATWDSVDRIVAAAPVLTSTSCRMTVRAAGAGFDLNRGDAESLQRLFAALGIPPARGDTLTDALLDWRDTDTIPRLLGAERGWYREARRTEPRDSLFADVHELLRVRGFEHFGDTLAVFTTDSAPMPLSHTPIAVLATLPGLSPVALVRIQELRERHERVPELIALGGGLAADDRAMLLAHYRELSERTTAVPESWTISATAEAGSPGIAQTVTVRFARAGTRVAVMGRR